MGTVKLKLHSSQLGISQKPKVQNPYPMNMRVQLHLGSSGISCGLRKVGPRERKPLWRSRVLSTEAIQAVQSLKLAKSPSKLEQVFNTRLTRLLKADLLDTLADLQRQNELDLALKPINLGEICAMKYNDGAVCYFDLSEVFDFVRKESWYAPDISLYNDMILLLGKNKLVQKAEDLFDELKKEGLQPDTRAYTELIGAYFQVDMVDKAMETYTQMKASGCAPDKLTLMIMVRNLGKAGKEELAASVKKDIETYLDDPKKFLQEVERKYAKGSLDLV